MHTHVGHKNQYPTVVEEVNVGTTVPSPPPLPQRIPHVNSPQWMNQANEYRPRNEAMLLVLLLLCLGLAWLGVYLFWNVPNAMSYFYTFILFDACFPFTIKFMNHYRLSRWMDVCIHTTSVCVRECINGTQCRLPPKSFIWIFHSGRFSPGTAPPPPLHFTCPWTTCTYMHIKWYDTKSFVFSYIL